MIKKITSSFINDAKEYFLTGTLCGNIMRERWVNDRLLDLDNEAASLGSYFEYYFTLLVTGAGSLPKDGKVPELIQTAKGKPISKYELAQVNAVRLKSYFEKMGLKIIKAGVKLTKGRFEGTIDLIVECTRDIQFDDGTSWNEGQRLVFDLKYSGLITDRWDKFGWAGMTREGTHIQKEYHGVQAIQYGMIGELPFYFLIVSSTNDTDVELIRVPVEQEQIDEHILMANQLFEKFEFEKQIGFEARPHHITCLACPLRGECQDKHEYPHPKTMIWE